MYCTSNFDHLSGNPINMQALKVVFVSGFFPIELNKKKDFSLTPKYLDN